jgi:iron complex outermembrane receptor protein
MNIQLLAIAMLLSTTTASAQIEIQDSTDNIDNISIDTLDKSDHEELEEIQVSTTRSSRSIQDIPTRIEFIAGEELDEKANMKPGDIRMMLSESTGIQTQTTSATSANSSIRIQGLDGRYTQILKDGFPMFSGAASGLGLLQTPPLDLKQVEVIKGSASTLYGGGAIAGLVNLISKTPSTIRELRFHINGTSALGLDVNAFYGKRNKRWGTTLFASHNSNAPYDPADIDLTAIPKFERYTFNPKVFFYPSGKTTIVAGVNTTFENRIGGDLHYIKGEVDTLNGYYERNKSKRLSSQLSATHTLSESNSLSFKNSYSYFNRIITSPGYEFEGTQHTTYTEATYSHNGDKLDLVGGANLLTDAFREELRSGIALRDYDQTTIGGFVQSTWHPAMKLFIEMGLRGDYVGEYGFALLPRLSFLYKHSAKLSSRIGGGYGYKAPTIFTEESERVQYRNVVPISRYMNSLEKSYGANWDLNYRTSIAGKLTISFNQLFFYTRINTPLLMQPVAGGLYEFHNIDGHIDSKGTETNIKLGYHDFKLFLGYTYTDAYVHQGGSKEGSTLTPKNRLNTVLMYEVEEKWKVGLEAYYYSPQKLSDGATGRDYWLCGFMAERLWEKFSIYINFENFLDSRQTRFDTIYTGMLTSPQFRDIYAPLDGFVVNGGIKLRL